MNYRNLSDIFPSYYAEKPTESYVRARCEAHLENAHVYRDFYEWIKPISCPYKREAYATIMLHMMEEKTMVDYEEERLCGSVLDEVEPELKKIIRYARTDQIAEEMLYSDLGVAPRSDAETTLAEHVYELDARVTFLAHEVEQLKADRQTPLPHENSYVELVDWIKKEKMTGRDWLKEAGYNRSQMARNLSNHLGWVVDIHALNRAINRK